MPGSVARLPNGPAGGQGEIPPVELYKAAIDEYRFQAQFNWTRTQYMLVFNTGILVAGAVVASQSGRSAALVFGLGAAASVLSFLVMRTQHDYYRAARDRLRRIEAAVGVPEDQRIDTTATMGARRRRVSVTTLVYFLLAAVGVADLVGMAVILYR
jgi:hypothetical protein